jgi:hypothetical protein
VRGFKNEKVSHPEGSIDKKRDIEIIKNEILERGKKVVESFLAKKVAEENSKILAKEIMDIIKRGEWLYEKLESFDEEKRLLIKTLSKELGILSIKPIIYLGNEEKMGDEEKIGDLSLNLKDEEEIADLNEEEKKELGVKSSLDKLISLCYNKLDLIIFFTIVGGKEIGALEIKRGANILDAAQNVHSDFKEKFKKAEVLTFEKLIEAGNWQEAKEKGLIRTEGKQYLVQDGDIIEFKI